MVTEPRRSAWALMRSGPFSRLWKAGFVSSTGDWVAMLATLSLADELAGGGGIVLALTSRIVPGLFFAAIGGIIADRLNRKHAMVIAELGRALLVFSLAFTDTIQQLILVSLALEALTLIFQPAKEATVPTLVSKAELVQANSLSLSASYGTFPLGAAIFTGLASLGDNITLGGLLPGTQEGLAFLVDAASYLISALLIATLPTMARRRRPPGSRRWSPMAVVRDLKEGLVFVGSHRRVRPVVLAMTSALGGGGIIVVLGKPFATDVLQSGAAGFPALLTGFGLGAGAGIILVTIFGPRFKYKDVLFGFALLLTGIALSAAAFVQTIIGAVGWVAIMGIGAGGAYVLGFAHLHEQADDAVRGRTFAALFSLLRIGLLTSMMLALPLAGFFDGMLPGLLGNGTRDVLLLGGLTMLVTGSLTLWSVRRSIFLLGQTSRPEMDAASEAYRKYRKTVTGLGETAEMDRIDGGTAK
jgi:dTMP kinase